MTESVTLTKRQADVMLQRLADAKATIGDLVEAIEQLRWSFANAWPEDHVRIDVLDGMLESIVGLAARGGEQA